MSDALRTEIIDYETQFDLTDTTETTMVPANGERIGILTGLAISSLTEQTITIKAGSTVKRKYYIPDNSGPCEILPDSYITAGAAGEAITITSNSSSHATSVTARYNYK